MCDPVLQNKVYAQDDMYKVIGLIDARAVLQWMMHDVGITCRCILMQAALSSVPTYRLVKEV